MAIERLQNLDALAHTDGQFTHRGVGVDGQAMALGQLRDLSPRRAAVDERPARRLCAVDYVLPHVQRGKELEGLMHHPHARGHSIER